MPYEISESCISCGICADECPTGSITQIGILYVIDQQTCTECGSCASACPRKLVLECRPVPANKKKGVGDTTEPYIPLQGLEERVDHTPSLDIALHSWRRAEQPPEKL